MKDINVRGEAKRGKLRPTHAFGRIGWHSGTHDVVMLLVAMIIMVTYVPAIPMSSIWLPLRAYG